MDVKAIGWGFQMDKKNWVVMVDQNQFGEVKEALLRAGIKVFETSAYRFEFCEETLPQCIALVINPFATIYEDVAFYGNTVKEKIIDAQEQMTQIANENEIPIYQIDYSIDCAKRIAENIKQHMLPARG